MEYFEILKRGCVIDHIQGTFENSGEPVDKIGWNLGYIVLGPIDYDFVLTISAKTSDFTNFRSCSQFEFQPL